MANVSTYRKYAPFTIDRLISVCNVILEPSAKPPIMKRTLRYYTAQGVVPKPIGSPKFARYGYEHLLAILTARALQDQGSKLHEVKLELADIARGQFTRYENLIEEWLKSNRSNLELIVKESAAEVEPSKMSADAYPSGVLRKHFQLTPNTTLAVEGKAVLRTELLAAQGALDAMLKDLK